MIKYRKLGLVLYALSFLCLIGLITYGLLLSPKLDELLIIVLIYAFISLFSFYPENSVKDSNRYNTYIRESKEELPLIGVIINNYDAFYEGNVSVDEEFASLTRDALRYGIFFIITASGDNSIRRKIKQNFNTILALRLNDEMAYNSIFTKINNLPKDTIGRGLFKTDKVYEFQTADIIDTTKENEYLVNIGNRLKEINNKHSKL